VTTANPDSSPLALAAAADDPAWLSRIVPAADPDDVDPDHHLWRNGNLWWIAFTVHRGYQQERLRFSLKTRDVVEARRRRDAVFALYAAAADCEISIRLKPGRPARRRARALTP
jgi:hypothetical protein